MAPQPCHGPSSAGVAAPAAVAGAGLGWPPTTPRRGEVEWCWVMVWVMKVGMMMVVMMVVVVVGEEDGSGGGWWC